MMEFPIDEGTGDISARRSSYLHPLGNMDDARSTQSSKSSAHRTEEGGIVVQFGGKDGQVFKFGGDVDELERERLLAIMDTRHMTWRHRWFSILEGRPHEIDETLSHIFNISSFSVVIISCIVFAVASMPEVVGDPRAQVSYANSLFIIEAICIFYFICEAVLRVVCVPVNLLVDFLFIVDLITIVGFFTDFFAGSSVSFLRVLRLLRVFRVMKISRYSRTLQLVAKVFAQSAGGLSVLLMPIFLVVITAATVLYFVEAVAYADWDEGRRRWMSGGRPIMTQSIFDGIWFVMATITTIGFGDVIPQTLVGKLIASLLALFGVLTLSFPNLVLGANLESAFALHKKSAARTFLSKRFKKVYFMSAFLRRARIAVETRKMREEQLHDFAASGAKLSEEDTVHKVLNKAAEAAGFGYTTIPAVYRLFPEMDDEPSDSALTGLTSDRGRPLFFELTPNQCKSLVQGVEDFIDDDNVRSWSYKGLRVREILQVIFEGYSGVCTAQEMFYSIPNQADEEITVHDVAVAGLFLGGAEYLNVFALRRSSVQYVVSLTYKAVLELWLQRENTCIECRRSAEYSRFIWKQTTGKISNFTHSSLSKSYPTWAAREKYAGMGTADSSPDFKLHIGVTPTEIGELRRLLGLRTSDLGTVIPDIDRFEEQALERLAIPGANAYLRSLQEDNPTMIKSFTSPAKTLRGGDNSIKKDGDSLLTLGTPTASPRSRGTSLAGKNETSTNSNTHLGAYSFPQSPSSGGGETPGGRGTTGEHSHHRANDTSETTTEEEKKKDEQTKLVFQLMLLHQKDLASSWNYELQSPGPVTAFNTNTPKTTGGNKLF